MVLVEDNRYRLNPDNEKLVRYYANAIAHLTDIPSWAAQAA